ncbi:protoporphyrinogen oxidase [Jiangella asiatica]|uniref:Coproporphyrinogen III oxidase n=1 Tax=Jiangella asiatica TaxID=2530372 RepID=A0A4R5CLB2_9ACTN|nr:protoporphyrinogen oxidase [Jiangella asiatica]TDD98262.1 protoporphyrinogen oxidase [Jiangella asiatica]
MTAVRVGVVGGGISGLAAAWFLRQSLGPAAEIIVFEKKPDVGGHLRVSDVAGHPVDEGAESLLARRPEAVDLAAAVGLADDVVHPAPVGAGLWSRDRIHPLPAGTVMGVPADPARLAGVLTTAEVDAARAADAAPDGMPLESDVAIGRLVRDRFGAAVADRMVEPLLGGVYAGRADELSLDATVPALAAAARTHPSLASAAAAATRPASAQGPTESRPVFAGLRGGVGRLPGAVAAAARADVRTGVTVRSLERRSDGFRLITGPVPDPSAVDVDAVVVATPATASARLLSSVVPAAAASLAEIDAASMAIVTLAMPAAAFPQPPSSSGFLVPPVDGRTIKAVTYSSVKWPWLGSRTGELVLLRASLGRHREVEQLQRDDDELVAAVRADLGTAVGLTGQIVDARVTRWGGALPQYAVGHLDRVARVHSAVAGVPGLAVCGAVYDGVGVAACIGSARDAAARVVARLSQRRVRIES